MDLFLKEFLNIKLSHDYFKNGISPYFELTPTNTTRRTLKNFNIFRKLLTNQFSLSVGVRKENAQIIDEIRGLKDLNFLLINKHSYFFNYTNLRPFDRMEEILYLSIGEEGHQEQQNITTQNDHIIQLRGLVFNQRFEEAGIIEIKNTSQEVLLRFDVTSSEVNQQNINLNPFGEGYYEIWVDNNLIERFYATDGDFPEKCIGVLHIKGNDVCNLLENEEVVTGSIEFNSKECFWEYEIALSDQRKIEIHDLRIDGKEILEFQPVYDSLLADKVALKVFRSKLSKKIYEEMDRQMELILEYSNLHSERKSELTIKLPAPDVTRIHTQNTEDGGAISVAPTLVYI